jgi:hypothetical protein
VEATSVRPGYELWRPNREKSETKTTRFIVAFVLLVSAGLVVVITLGGWTRLEGASVGVASLIWAGLYVLFALLVLRWNRGVLPVAAALAIVMLIFAAIAGPAWFERDKEGLADPALDASLLGLVTLLLVPVQALLIVAAMQGFRQAWNIEVERRPGARERRAAATR